MVRAVLTAAPLVLNLFSSCLALAPSRAWAPVHAHVASKASPRSGASDLGEQLAVDAVAGPYTWEMDRRRRALLAEALFVRWQDVEEDTPGHRGVKRHVVIASARDIGFIYLAMYGPLAMIVVALHYAGLLRRFYPLVIAATLMVGLTSFDISNQSLSAVMDAPNVISALHASVLGLGTGTFSLCCERRQLATVDRSSVWKWMIVAVIFSIYQLVNHMVSYVCTLSERIVFLNLCPLISLVVEGAVMPEGKQPVTTNRTRAALLLMAFGATLYSAEKTTMTASGLVAASGLAVLCIPYRLTQRYLITGDCASLPVGFMAALDGLTLVIPSTVLAANSLDGGVESVRRWLSSDSVLIMLAFSSVSIATNHVLGLLLLKVNTATSYMVFCNIANFLIIAMSFIFFHEVMETRLEFFGMLLSLCSGLWYAMEVSYWKGQGSGSEAQLTPGKP